MDDSVTQMIQKSNYNIWRKKFFLFLGAEGLTSKMFCCIIFLGLWGKEVTTMGDFLLAVTVSILESVVGGLILKLFFKD